MLSKLIDWLFGSDKKKEEPSELAAWPFPTADNPPKVARTPNAKSHAKKSATAKKPAAKKPATAKKPAGKKTTTGTKKTTTKKTTSKKK